MVVTYAMRRSHDLTRFSEPEVMIAGHVRAPYVPLTNVRIDRRHAMLACDAGRLVALAGLAAAIAAGHAPTALIAAVALIEGCLTVIFNLAELSAVQLLVPSKQLETGLAQNEARVRGAGPCWGCGEPIRWVDSGHR